MKLSPKQLVIIGFGVVVVGLLVYIAVTNSQEPPPTDRNSGSSGINFGINW